MDRLTGDSLGSYLEELEFLTFLSSGSFSREVFYFSSLLLRSCFRAALKLISMCEFLTRFSRLHCTACRCLHFYSLTFSNFSLSSLFSRKLTF